MEDGLSGDSAHDATDDKNGSTTATLKGGKLETLLDGKVALVTGGSSGSGRAIALAFAEHGAHAVVVADLQAEPREGGVPTHLRIRETTSSRALFIECDVSSIDQLASAVDLTEELGGIDIMVNNAGIYATQAALAITEEEFNRMMSVNVKGVCFGVQAAARRMVSRGSGTIVNVGSGAGVVGSAGFALYCASKGAVRAMTFALAAEFGPQGLRVNLIEPGYIETAMTSVDVPVAHDEMGEATQVETLIPLRRPGLPQDVANAAVFLASDLADYVNGASLLVDGGRVNTAPDVSR